MRVKQYGLRELTSPLVYCLVYINLFAHERMGKVYEVLAVVQDLLTTCADHVKCKSVRVRADKADLMCYWENFHKDKTSYLERGTIKGIPVVDTTSALESVPTELEGRRELLLLLTTSHKITL